MFVVYQKISREISTKKVGESILLNSAETLWLDLYFIFGFCHKGLTSKA